MKLLHIVMSQWCSHEMKVPCSFDCWMGSLHTGVLYFLYPSGSYDSCFEPLQSKTILPVLGTAKENSCVRKTHQMFIFAVDLVPKSRQYLGSV